VVSHLAQLDLKASFRLKASLLLIMSSNSGNDRTIHEHHAGDRTGSTQAPEDAATKSDKVVSSDIEIVWLHVLLLLILMHQPIASTVSLICYKGSLGIAALGAHKFACLLIAALLQSAVGALASECRCSPECTCEEFEATSKCYCQDGCRCGGKGVDAVA
jgi:hypothetical protein